MGGASSPISSLGRLGYVVYSRVSIGCVRGKFILVWMESQDGRGGVLKQPITLLDGLLLDMDRIIKQLEKRLEEDRVLLTELQSIYAFYRNDLEQVKLDKWRLDRPTATESNILRTWEFVK